MNKCEAQFTAKAQIQMHIGRVELATKIIIVLIFCNKSTQTTDIKTALKLAEELGI